MPRIDYFTPSQILYRNPSIAKVWNAPQIGYLLMLKLIKGKKLKRGCLCSESDVKALFTFAFNPNPPN